MTQLLFDDEGVITRRQWWAGTLLLVAMQLAAESIVARWLAPMGLDGPALLFVSLVLLIPFHAVNAKRFRACGRSPALALWGGGLAGLTILAGAFLRWPSLDLALGFGLCLVILWYIIDLGILDHGLVIRDSTT